MFWKLFKKKDKPIIWKCLKCEHFGWWDGDYCCMDRQKVLVTSSTGRITQEQYDSMSRKFKHCWFFKKRKNSKFKDGLYLPINKLIK